MSSALRACERTSLDNNAWMSFNTSYASCLFSYQQVHARCDVKNGRGVNLLSGSQPYWSPSYLQQRDTHIEVSHLGVVRQVTMCLRCHVLNVYDISPGLVRLTLKV